jgi:hypothetical protein
MTKTGKAFLVTKIYSVITFAIKYKKINNKKSKKSFWLTELIAAFFTMR